MVLDNNDIIDSSEVDAEILGTGVLMAFVLVPIHQCFTQAYIRVDSKRTKKSDDLTVFFALLGYVLIKAACTTLMKLSPGANSSMFYAKLLCT